MDTTLRDGEQTSGVSFVPHEKLMIARLLLEDLKVDRIEVASARVSEGEAKAVKMICDWAARRGMLSRVEVLGFVDGKISVDWIYNAGCRVINLLTKGSEKHCKFQLKKTLEQHLADIRQVVSYAHEKGMDVNVYLEDWSNGIKDSPDYVFGLMDGLKDCGIKRFMLPDTLGILNPLQVIEYMRKMKKRYPDVHFDFHAHNDYDLAVSNVLAAVLSGGLLLGAVFMATDYVTSPFTLKGKLVYGVALGIVTFAIRYWGSYTEGVSFALLFMNLWVPYINDLTRQTPYGYVKPAKKAKEGADK